VEARFKPKKGEAMNNYAKHNQTQVGTANDNSAGAVRNIEEVELFVEELEQVIAPTSGVKR
jgi:hypothetical protein